ncbi:MAG: hypothetical protein LBK82_11825, partial [Planctomycetaceae bacterium]|nr:hypothetical protein [Planctomycetaceae bacterium]
GKARGGGAVYEEKRKRGVTLFIVLALMTMFAMLITVFVISTTRSRKQAEHMAKALLEPAVKTDGYSTITSNFDDALEKLLIGDDFKSVLAPHSILENLYGHPVLRSAGDLLTGTFGRTNTTIIKDTMETFLYCSSFGFNPSTQININSIPDQLPLGDLSGFVLTITKAGNGANAEQLVGKSTFILNFSLDFTDGGEKKWNCLQLAPFINCNLTLAEQVTALNGKDDSSGIGCDFIINSPAFGGTGPGFDFSATGAALSEKDEKNTTSTSFQYALRPNVLAPSTNNTQEYKKYLNDNLVLMNPDYTAPDYLNMFLAWNNVQGKWKWNETKKEWVWIWVLGDSLYPSVPKTIPSFHRPQLVKYWENDITTKSVNPITGKSVVTAIDWNKLRKIVLRPLPIDHPNFTSSNPATKYNPDDVIPLQWQKTFKFLTQGPWDVDNDGDGVADGIWVDAGLGTTSINGKRYKKLVSYYVLDMDGRLNVNVHGNQAHNSSFDSELRGSGSGTAEIRLDLGLKTIEKTLKKTIDTNTFSQITDGDSDNIGRYGTNKLPGNGATNFDVMGIYPDTYGGSGVGGNVPDWWGNAPITFDALGNRTVTSNTNIFAGNPYLINPYSQGNDLPFDISDLQYLLRSVGDIDYMALPKRLRNLLGEAATDQYKLSPYRLFLTTRSNDIPVFSRFGGTTSAENFSGLYDYIYTKIYGSDANKANALFNLLPEEIRHGEKINLNRLTFHNNWTTGSTVSLLKEKAKFAQEIFYLLCVLGYDQIETKNYTEESLTKADIYTRLAQWSVNLVDFIDPDATMTPFVFCAEPFSTSLTSPYNNETDTNTLLTTTSSTWTLPTTTPNLKLIWGFEKPEVALTETFAVHNRRVADSVKERGDTTDEICETCGYDKRRINNACTADPNPHDTDFDQVLIPQGSLFVELYRQGNPNRVGYPKNDIVNSTTDPDPGNLNLAKTATDGSYIWRLVVGKRTTSGELGSWTETATDTDDALSQSRTDKTYQFGLKYPFPGGTGTASGIEPERIIWFGDTIPTGTENYSYINVGGVDPNSDNPVIGTSAYGADGANVTLEPNEYLVIGPRLYTSFD